jgi:hypothetical protein
MGEVGEGGGGAGGREKMREGEGEGIQGGEGEREGEGGEGGVSVWESLESPSLNGGSVPVKDIILRMWDKIFGEKSEYEELVYFGNIKPIYAVRNFFLRNPGPEFVVSR